jgi:glycogen operon protein
MDSEGLDFEIPIVKDRQWHLAVNTAEPPPKDIIDQGKEPPIIGSTLQVEARSIVVLLSR